MIKFRLRTRSLVSLIPIVGALDKSPFNEIAHTYYAVSQQTVNDLHVLNILVENPKIERRRLLEIKKTLEGLLNVVRHAQVQDLDRKAFEGIEAYRTYRDHLRQQRPFDAIPCFPDILGPLKYRVEQVLQSVARHLGEDIGSFSATADKVVSVSGRQFLNRPPLEEYCGDEAYFSSLAPLDTPASPKSFYFSSLKRPQNRSLSSSRTLLDSAFTEEEEFKKQASKDFKRREPTIQVRASIDRPVAASSSDTTESPKYHEHCFDLQEILNKISDEGSHELDKLMTREEQEAFLKLSTQMSQVEMFETLKKSYGVGEDMDAKLVVTGSNIRGIEHPSDKIVLFQKEDGEWQMKRLRRYYLIDAERRIQEELEEKDALVLIIDAQEFFSLSKTDKPIKLRWREIMSLPKGHGE